MSEGPTYRPDLTEIRSSTAELLHGDGTGNYCCKTRRKTEFSITSFVFKQCLFREIIIVLNIKTTTVERCSAYFPNVFLRFCILQWPCPFIAVTKLLLHTKTRCWRINNTTQSQKLYFLVPPSADILRIRKYFKQTLLNFITITFEDPYTFRTVNRFLREMVMTHWNSLKSRGYSEPTQTELNTVNPQCQISFESVEYFRRWNISTDTYYLSVRYSFFYVYRARNAKRHEQKHLKAYNSPKHEMSEAPPGIKIKNE